MILVPSSVYITHNTVVTIKSMAYKNRVRCGLAKPLKLIAQRIVVEMLHLVEKVLQTAMQLVLLV